ncbi:unnamed protein product [Orchesella dallaii]|uniref:DUF1279 domain-containing protein n=1 Tax=Orchesella dallaii TaxID=48710 RepID=A0ABP1QF18_9HEXA
MAFMSTSTRIFVCSNIHKLSCFRTATSQTPSIYFIPNVAASFQSNRNQSTLSHVRVSSVEFQSRPRQKGFLKLTGSQAHAINSTSIQILRMITSTVPASADVKVDTTKSKDENVTKSVDINSQEESSSTTPSQEGLSTKEKLKRAVRDYGATVIVFHVTMSLMSLGFFYLLVSSGLDVVAVLAKIGISETFLQSKITEEASKFVVAYAVHKVFAPLRITITLTATPLIVRKLRNMGILKQAVKAKST